MTEDMEIYNRSKRRIAIPHGGDLLSEYIAIDAFLVLTCSPPQSLIVDSLLPNIVDQVRHSSSLSSVRLRTTLLVSF
jgi:hypothetical protein